MGFSTKVLGFSTTCCYRRNKELVCAFTNLRTPASSYSSSHLFLSVLLKIPNFTSLVWTDRSITPKPHLQLCQSLTSKPPPLFSPRWWHNLGSGQSLHSRPLIWEYLKTTPRPFSWTSEILHWAARAQYHLLISWAALHWVCIHSSSLYVILILFILVDGISLC